MAKKDERFKESDFGYIGEPFNCNYRWAASVRTTMRPHPITVDAKMVAQSGGVLDSAAIDRAGCGHRENRQRCGRPASAHVSDKVVPVYLTKDCSNSELREWLLGFEELLAELKIDGLVFVATGFKALDDAIRQEG